MHHTGKLDIIFPGEARRLRVWKPDASGKESEDTSQTGRNQRAPEPVRELEGRTAHPCRKHSGMVVKFLSRIEPVRYKKL